MISVTLWLLLTIKTGMETGISWISSQAWAGILGKYQIFFYILTNVDLSFLLLIESEECWHVNLWKLVWNHKKVSALQNLLIRYSTTSCTIVTAILINLSFLSDVPSLWLVTLVQWIQLHSSNWWLRSVGKHSCWSWSSQPCKTQNGFWNDNSTR